MNRKWTQYLKMINRISILLFLLFCYFAVISPQEPAAKETKTNDRDAALVAVPSDDDGATVEEEEEGVQTEGSRKVTVGLGNPDNPNVEMFKPTKEWQTVKPGQAVPKGLHIRMNFQTKEVEAKLMDEEEGTASGTNTAAAVSGDAATDTGTGPPPAAAADGDSGPPSAADGGDSGSDSGMKYWKEGDREGILNTKSKHFTVKELKDALKEFKANKDDVQDEKIKEEALKKKFKTYDELKKDFKTMKMDVKTDNEIITNLFKLYKNTSISVDDRKRILSDFEYYLHQIDNAVDFANMGGINLVVKDLNHTDPEIRSEAAFVIGGAVQSNPKVQIKAIEAGAMQQLIRMLPTEKELSLRSRVLYALSCLLRHFPYAQKKFLELGGLTVLTSLFNQQGVEKLQVKAISLTHDLLLEKQNVIKTADIKDPNEKEKLRQYKIVHLREAMVDQGWCDYIPNLLFAQDHDTREKVLEAMGLVLDNCKQTFTKSVGELQKLKLEYKKLSDEERQEGDDDYFQKLFSSLTNIISSLRSGGRDEL